MNPHAEYKYHKRSYYKSAVLFCQKSHFPTPYWFDDVHHDIQEMQPVSQLAKESNRRLTHGIDWLTQKTGLCTDNPEKGDLLTSCVMFFEAPHTHARSDYADDTEE